MAWEQWLTVIGFLVSGLGGIICIILWYLITGTIQDLRKMEADIQSHRLDVANNFARKTEVDSRFDRFQDTLENLQNSISKIDITISAMAERMNVTRQHT